MGTKMLWGIYFACFQSKLKYGIMFCSGDGKSAKIFHLQKKVIMLISGVQKCESCVYLENFKYLH